MGGYVINFTVYTMAMIGLICFAIFVFKKITDGTIRSKGTNILKVEESLSLSPRKTLHIVKAGEEKFLIASDIDRTTLISKLKENTLYEIKNLNETINTTDTISEDIQVENINTKEDLTEVECIEIPDETEELPKIVHLETVDPKKKRITPRQSLDTRAEQTVVQVKRKQPASSKKIKENNQKISLMKQMAKRINEL